MDLKLINYRGGLVKFFLPNTWVEEYQPNGGGTFYEDLHDSGILRLNVLTFEHEPRKDDETVNDAFAYSPFAKTGLITSLPNGNVMLSYQRNDMEENENLRIYFWEILNRVAPKYTRIAVFSYTIFSEQEGDAPVSTELEFIREQIPNAIFAPEIGK